MISANFLRFYINGEWATPLGQERLGVETPATEEIAAEVRAPLAEARAVARRLRAGQVNLNSPEGDTFAPFGGYKQSGNGREYADWGIHDFCEVKAIVGYGEA